MDIEKRFFSKVKVSSSGCWEWQGWLDGGGYGRFRDHGEYVKSHIGCVTN